MKYIIILTLPVFFAMIYSCGTNDNKHTENTAFKVDFEIIKTGVLHGAGEEGFSQEAIRVSNIEEFNQIRNKINSVNEEVEDDIIRSGSFFDEQMLVFVFDKVKGTGGYTFETKQITISSDTLTVQMLSKAPEGSATSIMTQPFQILSLDKSDKEIKLKVIE